MISLPDHAYAMRFVADRAHIDELRHVNNAVWVQWNQDPAVAHWRAMASADDDARWIWVVVRHEIDYRRALLPGEAVTARTWVADAAKGARFDRLMQFSGDDGRVHVEARTSWAMLDRATGRPQRVPPHIVALFAGAA